MLTRWNQWDSSQFLFDELWRRMLHSFEEIEPRRSWAAQSTWPLLNLYDAGDRILLQAEVPGMSEKDIQITLSQDAVTITGERPVENPAGYSVHRKERPSIQFSRSLTCPCKVNPDKATATVRAGMLVITLNKAADAKPRQITVKAK